MVVMGEIGVGNSDFLFIFAYDFILIHHEEISLYIMKRFSYSS